VSERPAGGTPRGKGDQPKVLALRYELGGLFAAISLGPLQSLILSLRVADGLGQHLVQLSLGLLRFACRFPLVHVAYVGMLEGDLHPTGAACMSASVRTTDLSQTSRHVRKVPTGDIGRVMK